MEPQLVEQVKQFLHAVYTRRRMFIIIAATVALVGCCFDFLQDEGLRGEKHGIH